MVRTRIEPFHGANDATQHARVARMTPREPSHAAALAAVGLGFELDPGDELGLDGDEVVALRDAASFLAYAPPPALPPAAHWRRLTTSLAAPPPEVQLRRRRRATVAGLALGGAGLLAAAAAVVLAVRASGARDEWRRVAREAQREVLVASAELRGARLLAEELDLRLRGAESALAPVRAPELQVASFGGERAGKARVLLDPGSRRWVVVAFELPAIADRDYQLWLVPDGGAPISAGVLRRGADGVLELTGAVPSAVGTFRPAISLEPLGGSPAPTSIQLVGEPL